MELKEFIKVLKRRWVWVAGGLGLGILGGLGSLRMSSKPTFEASALLFVARTAQAPQEDFYTYDGFHAQQTAYHYTDTVVGLAKSFGATESTRKSEQLVEVKITYSNLDKPPAMVKEAAQQGLRKLVDRLVATSSSLNKQGDPEISLQLVDDIQVREKKTSKILIVGVGIGIGLGFGVLLASLKEYLS